MCLIWYGWGPKDGSPVISLSSFAVAIIKNSSSIPGIRASIICEDLYRILGMGQSLWDVSVEWLEKQHTKREWMGRSVDDLDKTVMDGEVVILAYGDV